VINRTISPKDVIYPGFEAVGPDCYYTSALSQLDDIDALLRRYGHAGIRGCAAIGDYASHYGRLTRALRVVVPPASIYAFDIDLEAIGFCARELGARAVPTSWQPDQDAAPDNLDLLVCSSLLTHTDIEHWRSALRAWIRMVRPGGFVFFTYLSDAYVTDWRAGRLDHYGTYTPEQREEAERQLSETGFGFAPLSGLYTNDDRYGIAFVTSAIIRAEAQAAGFDVLELVPASKSTFGQELAVLRRPPPGRPAPSAGVRVIAFYDACGDWWTGLCNSQSRSPLPTDLGFYDPRVAEVREEQAALARAHGIDGFCISFSSGGAPLAHSTLCDLLHSGRPDFPFCLIWVEEGEPARAPGEVFASLLPHLRDTRYIRVEGIPLLVVRYPRRLTAPRETTQQWRDLALQNGLPGLHLCAVEPLAPDSPLDLGFDSCLEFPDDPDISYAELAARSVTRARSSEWAGGFYLEPDDFDGLRALRATQRAIMGPASGPVLLRRLRETLDRSSPQTVRLLEEMDELLAEREQSFAQLNSLIEASISLSAAPEPRRNLAIEANELKPATGTWYLDDIGSASGDAAKAPIVDVRRGDCRFAGWAYFTDPKQSEAKRFLVLQALTGTEERFYPLKERTPRPDVVSAMQTRYPDLSVLCGFDEDVPLGELPPGDYRVGFVQSCEGHLSCNFATSVIRAI
jgi:SAM-dependent methyltransferase